MIQRSTLTTTAGTRGFGVKRLLDLPMGWSDQWSALGLKASAQTYSKPDPLKLSPTARKSQSEIGAAVGRPTFGVSLGQRRI